MRVEESVRVVHRVVHRVVDGVVWAKVVLWRCYAARAAPLQNVNRCCQ